MPLYQFVIQLFATGLLKVEIILGKSQRRHICRANMYQRSARILDPGNLKGQLGPPVSNHQFSKVASVFVCVCEARHWEHPKTLFWPDNPGTSEHIMNTFGNVYRTSVSNWEHLRTLENIYRTFENIWHHLENNWEPIIVSLVQFEHFYQNAVWMDRIG